MFAETEMHEILSNPRMWHPIFGPQLMAKWGSKYLSRQYQLLDSVCGDDAALIASPGLLAGRTLHDKRRAPLVSLVLQP